jgi:hypothetical protein
MKSLFLAALLTLSACTDPTLSTDLTFGPNGVSANPALSGSVGGATVSVEAN